MDHQSGLAAGATETDVREETVSERVIDAVSEATGTDPVELEPLYNVVDPDALNAIFASGGAGESSDTELRFTMAGCDVLVRDGGNVVVTPPADRDDVSRTTVRNVE